MTDLLHTHLDFGFDPKCPACDQLARDMQSAAGQPRDLEELELLEAVSA